MDDALSPATSPTLPVGSGSDHEENDKTLPLTLTAGNDLGGKPADEPVMPTQVADTPASEEETPTTDLKLPTPAA